MRLITIVFLVVTVLWVPLDVIFWIRFLRAPQEKKRHRLAAACLGIALFFSLFMWLMRVWS